MRTEDRARLTRALIISLIFHLFLFMGLNLFNWFSEGDSVNKYSPLTVKIESRPVLDTDIINEAKTDTPMELPKITGVELFSEKPETVSGEEPEETSVPIPVPAVEADYDPYAALFNETSSKTPVDPVPFEEGFKETPYIPPGTNSVDLEILATEEKKIDSQPVTPLEKNNSILSKDDISELAKALDSDYQISDSPSESEYKSMEFTYNDSPVQFDNPDTGRSLVSKPLITFPSRFSQLLSSDSTVVIGFLLNEDGRLYYLKVKQSSGYSEVDSFIISELRKWEFDKFPGSDDLKGTVTIILKGK